MYEEPRRVAGAGRPEPAFRRLENDLRSQIHRNEFPADTPLPTEAELARRYSVSRQTVRRAFHDLVAENLVFRVPGRGTFVTAPSGRYLRQFGSVEELMSLSADSQLQVVQPLTALVDPTAAGRLRLPDDRVAMTIFLRLHHGEAFSHTVAYLPPRVRERLGEVGELASAGTASRVTLIGLLDAVLPRPIRDAEQSITVAMAPADVATALEVETGSALLRIDRMYFDTDGEPVELAISHFHPDRYSYRVRLHRSPA
ncbi:DNA-binding transcriptional regulator, GntR family [Modestobacter sp. DSM 44400]|uniref:GntR family transcriptional regulator n=1 Tax=Modestobacter sp. DSM 44400 TaxID=1550230 RepID=UPI0008946117|nr:GntR family transcriptional regulator [Modestobacter sp. DSM 44400]SDY11182.1 DNA-binding transcriptional regulator, GntR family [Modestobacter sp. DSM 44400]